MAGPMLSSDGTRWGVARRLERDFQSRPGERRSSDERREPVSM